MTCEQNQQWYGGGLGDAPASRAQQGILAQADSEALQVSGGRTGEGVQAEGYNISDPFKDIITAKTADILMFGAAKSI